MAAEGRWSWIWGSSNKQNQPEESSDEIDPVSKSFTQLNEELRKAKISVGELEAKLHSESPEPEPEEPCKKDTADNSLRFKVWVLMQLLDC